MKFAGLGFIELVAAATLAGVPAWGAIPGRPGVLNYIEGSAQVDGGLVSARSAGTADLEAGQVLQTGQGKAEMLLTPGVFLRLGDNSAVRMISPGLTDTRVELLRGRALVEATDLQKENSVRVTEGGASTSLLKNGLYEFNADTPDVRVFDGRAAVTEEDRTIEVKKGKELQFNSDLKTEKFDRNVHDDLYNWSSLRSKYLSEASAASAKTYVVNNAGWFGSGWYWNPWYSTYSFLPGDGFLASPFGYGYYSPAYLYRNPVVIVQRPVYRGGASAAPHRPYLGQGGGTAPRAVFSQPRYSAASRSGGHGRWR